ncbi:MAG: putative lipoprotein [Gemmatimonadetes bacterium]|jgi:hypothetical protein|nr:putative lipoprotein [Gemmatimonadota bacterium]
MTRLLAHHRATITILSLVALLGNTACGEKSSGAAASGKPGSAGGDVSDSARKAGGAAGTNGDASTAPASASGVQALGADGKWIPANAGTPAAMSDEAERKAIEAAAGPLPQRARHDSVALASMTKPDSTLDKLWPVKNLPANAPGALLPSHRIVAYYGNPLSKKMGVLGEYPKDQMLSMLDKEVAKWAKADPGHPVIPALHMVVTVAQGDPGKNGLYRLQMRDSLVNEIYSWAKARKGVFFVDVQVGMSTIEAEIPRLGPILANPDVHLAVDPEFSMKPSGAKPSTKIGTLDARDINWAISFLDSIVRKNNLPPKILIVHRFTRKMVTNANLIKPTRNVQVVMDMDGWGPPWLKFDSYHDYIKKEPVQFTGFKLFYHNDTKSGASLLTPAEVLRLTPKPLYIQYQ